MIIGKKTEFAIELNFKERFSEKWVYGTYFFWFGGIRVGNSEDSADLRGCINGLVLFAAEEGERISTRYFNMDRREVFIRLCASIYDYAIPTDLTLVESSLLANLRLTDPYGYETSSYNIEHLGMSSFNSVYLLAIDSSLGQLRFIWQEKGGSIEEYTVEKDQFREVALGMIEFFEKLLIETPSLRGDLDLEMFIRFKNGDTLTTNPNLGLVKLNGLDLHQAVLDHLNLEGFVFYTACLRGTSLRFCNLRYAELESVKMMTSFFCYSDLESINAKNSKAMYTSFIHCNLSSADFSGADLRGSNFAHTNLLGANFSGADLGDANFKNAKFDSTTLWPTSYVPDI